jgi:hypothetical protein
VILYNSQQHLRGTCSTCIAFGQVPRCIPVDTCQLLKHHNCTSDDISTMRYHSVAALGTAVLYTARRSGLWSLCCCVVHGQQSSDCAPQLSPFPRISKASLSIAVRLRATAAGAVEHAVLYTCASPRHMPHGLPLPRHSTRVPSVAVYVVATAAVRCCAVVHRH